MTHDSLSKSFDFSRPFRPYFTAQADPYPVRELNVAWWKKDTAICCSHGELLRFSMTGSSWTSSSSATNSLPEGSWDPSGVALSYHLRSGSSQNSWAIVTQLLLWQRQTDCMWSVEGFLWQPSTRFHWCGRVWEVPDWQAGNGCGRCREAVMWPGAICIHIPLHLMQLCTIIEEGVRAPFQFPGKPKLQVSPGISLSNWLFAQLCLFYCFNELREPFQHLLSFFPLPANPLHAPPSALSYLMTSDERIKDTLQRRLLIQPQQETQMPQRNNRMSLLIFNARWNAWSCEKTFLFQQGMNCAKRMDGSVGQVTAHMMRM